MKVLITGGFGYLGGRIGQYFSSQGCDVTLGSRVQRGRPSWLREAKIVKITWESPALLEELCGEFDVIVHAAGVNAQECAEYPLKALEFNGVATGRILDASIRCEVKKFIYLSTAHVYASPLTGSIDERHCLNSLHPYATSHRAAEDLVRYYNKKRDIIGIVARLSNAIGAPAYSGPNCWTLMANDLCKQAVLTKKIKLKTSGLQIRDFITITNLARAIMHLQNLSKEKLGDGIFNIGGQSPMRVLDIAHLIQSRCCSVLGFNPEIICTQADSKDESNHLDFNVDKLMSTGFKLLENKIEEIDNNLIRCKKWFGSKSE